MLSLEYFFTCPHCGEEISMLLDLSMPRQEYIEDCEVCCKPIQVSYEVEGDVLVAFDARPTE